VNKRVIAAAALAAGLFVHTQGFTQVPINPSTSASTAADAATMSGPEKEARKIWRAVMKNIPVPGQGCFHVKYPNVGWEHLDCEETQPRAHHVPPRPTHGAPDIVGGGLNDYIAQVNGLISDASGKFPFVTGDTSETIAGGGTGAIAGPNEYSLQINTNDNGSTNACKNHLHCSVWQQFVYSTDYNQRGHAALYIQYWLLSWDASCPSGWWKVTNPSSTEIDCYKNSESLAVPDVPVTELGDVALYVTVVNGGADGVEFVFGDDYWQLTAEDSVLDVASVWNQAEFNVFGDADGSQAQFNRGSKITVQLGIYDNSHAAPTCVGHTGTTGETNNLNLGTCEAFTGPLDSPIPYIEFSESWPWPVLPPGICLACVAE